MATDPALSPSSAGLIGAEENLDDSLVLGPVIRNTRYCNIHSIVASSWQAESAEAHVFQPTNKAQARFMNRSVWLKLRKSTGFKREIKKDDGRIIFIVADEGETSSKKTEAPGLVPEEPDDTKPVTEAVLLNNPATSTLPTPLQLLGGLSPSTVGKSIFRRYLRECHGDESTPAFQIGGFPTTAAAKATEVEPDQLDMLGYFGTFNDRRLPIVDKMLPHEQDGADSAIPASWEEHSNIGPRRCKPRQTPAQRQLHFVLSLAADIAGKSLENDANGERLFGHGFMLEHLYPRQVRFSSSQALFEHVDQQRAWTGRIGRALQHLPGLLKKQEAASERAWLASVEELRRIFGVRAADGEEQRPQNTDIMRWIMERGFSGLGPEALAKLPEPFACYICDGEPVTRWMLRIRSHVRMRKWAGQELAKAPDVPGRANPVLMRLLEAHTAHQLVLGMKPILDRMLFVSQDDLRRCEWNAAIHSERDKAELECVSNRWKARCSVLKTKRRV